MRLCVERTLAAYFYNDRFISNGSTFNLLAFDRTSIAIGGFPSESPEIRPKAML